MAVGDALDVHKWIAARPLEATGPKTFGYFVLDRYDAADEKALNEVIDNRCSDDGGKADFVFSDYRGDGAVDRVGLHALIVTLRSGGAGCRVVVPSLKHVSSVPAVRRAILDKLRSAGADVVVVETA